MNTEYRRVALLNIEKSSCPFGLEIGFKDDDVVIDFMDPGIKESITDVINYWCSSKAITDGKSHNIRWISPNTLVVTAAFEKGSFDGDLTHRNALTSGDDSFSIGLVKLFWIGYKPKTRRGKGVSASVAIPLYIRCLYSQPLPPDTIELQLRMNRKNFRTIISDMIETIKRM